MFSRAAFGRAAIGAVAGFFIGPLVLTFSYQPEPPVDPKLLLASICVGMVLVAALCLAVGGRSVSVFWLYFVLAFGVITIIPCVHIGKTDSYCPLGTVYVNSPYRHVVPFVLVPHVLVGIGVAAIASRIRNKRRGPALSAHKWDRDLTSSFD